jgi:N-hydroxyarylamine O-acetyltransferase
VASIGDLSSYLTRIQVTAPTSLAQVHRAHATVIPFENFDSYSGTVPALDTASLEAKMVSQYRGGYCFEHNLLFMAALQALGVDEAAPMLARVRGRPDGERGPLNHLLLRVVADGQTWLADVGFGGTALLDPLPFEPGAESDQSGWRYRLTRDDREFVLQAWQDGGWVDYYGFIPEPVDLVDIDVANWYTATHPESPFVTGIIAGARRADCCHSLVISDKPVLIERTLEGATATPVPPGEVPTLFRTRFGLDHVSLGPDGQFAIAGPGDAGDADGARD